MLLKCYTQYASKFGKLSSGHRTRKGQFSFQSRRRAMPKNVQTAAQLHSSHKLAKMFKILQARLQQYVNCELPDVQAGFRKNRNHRSNCHHLLVHRKSKKIPEKHLLLYWLHQSLWLCRSQQTGKFFKRWEYQTTWPAFWEVCMQVKKQQLELDMEQQTGSKSGKEYVKAVYCHPAYLTDMQSTSCEMPGWMKCKLESRLLGEISMTSDTRMTPSLWHKVKKN